MRFSDSTVVKLHRLLITKRGDDNYFVVRWGGKSMLATRAAGVQAIRLLHGRHVGEVRWLLQTQNNSSSRPELQSFLQVLAGANMVRTVDGIRISQPELTLSTIVRFIYLHYLSPKLRRMARALPIGMLACAHYVINYAGNRKRIAKEADSASANIATVFSDFPAPRVQVIQRQHLRYLSRTKLDPEFLLDRRIEEVDQWLDMHIRCVGLDDLRAIASGGAILGIPHMNRFALAPLVLIKNGFRVCLMGTTSVSIGVERRKVWYQAFSKLPGYGDLKLLPNFNLESIREATELLQQGYLLVSHPDAALAPFSDETVKQRMRFFGMDYSGLPPGAIRVKLRGYWISAGLLFFWLAARSQVPFVPAVAVPCGRDSELRIHPPIAPGRPGLAVKDKTIELARCFYAFWEENLSAYPAEWFGWHLLQKWDLSSQEIYM